MKFSLIFEPEILEKHRANASDRKVQTLLRANSIFRVARSRNRLPFDEKPSGNIVCEDVKRRRIAAKVGGWFKKEKEKKRNARWGKKRKEDRDGMLSGEQLDRMQITGIHNLTLLTAFKRALKRCRFHFTAG